MLCRWAPQDDCCLKPSSMSSTCPPARFASGPRRENEQLHVSLHVITTLSLGSWRGKQEFISGLKDFAKSLPVRKTVACAGFEERFVCCPITTLLHAGGYHFGIHGLLGEWKRKSQAFAEGTYFQVKSAHNILWLKNFY